MKLTISIECVNLVSGRSTLPPIKHNGVAMKKAHVITYSMTEKQKEQVKNLKALLERVPKEPSFDPALEFQLELLMLLSIFCHNNKRFSAFLAEMRDIFQS